MAVVNFLDLNFWKFSEKKSFFSKKIFFIFFLKNRIQKKSDNFGELSLTLKTRKFFDFGLKH